MEYELSASELYRREVFMLPRYGWETIDKAAEQARNGDKRSREIIIERCLPYVVKLAWRYKTYLSHDEFLDIVGIGNLALLECLDKALTKEYPVGFLMKCALFQILKYINRKSDLLPCPTSRQPFSVLSYDEHTELTSRLADSSQPYRCPDDRISSALDTLTPLQRDVVLVKYGFSGRPADTLYQLGKVNGKSYKPSYADSHQRALQRIRRYFEQN